MASIRDLFVTIRYQVDKTSERSINESISKIKKNLSSIGIASSPFSNIATDLQNIKAQADALNTSLGNAVQILNQYASAIQNVTNNIAKAVQMTPANFWAYINNQATNTPFDMQGLLDALDGVSDHIDGIGSSISTSMSAFRRDFEAINLKALTFKGTMIDIEGIFRKILSIGALKQAASTVESMTQINLKLGAAAEYRGENSNDAQKTVLAAAQDMRADYKTVAAQASRLMNSEFSKFSSGGATDFIGAVSKMLRAQGFTSSESNSVIGAVTDAFLNRTKVSGSTFAELFASAPQLMDYFRQQEEYKGLSEHELRKLFEGGHLVNPVTFYNVIMDNLDDIEARFGRVKFTLTDAMTYIKNDFNYFLTETDDGQRILQNISTALVDLYQEGKKILAPAVDTITKIINGLGGIVPVLKTILSVMLAIKAVDIVTDLAGVIANVPTVILNTGTKAAKWVNGISKGFGLLKSGITGLGEDIALAGGLGNMKLSYLLTDLMGGGGVGSEASVTANAVLGKLGGVTVGKAALVAGGVVAAIAAIVDFIKFMNGEGSVFGKILEKIGYDTDVVRNKIKETLTGLGESLKNLFQSIWEPIKTVIESIWTLVKSLFEFLSPVFSDIFKIVGTLGKVLVDVISNVVDLASGILKPILSTIATMLEMIVTGLQNAFNILQPIIAVITGILSSGFSNFLQSIGAWIQLMIRLFEIWIRPLISVINLIGKLFGLFTDVGEELDDSADGSALSGVRKFTKAIDAMGDSVIRVMNSFTAFLMMLSGSATWEEVVGVWNGDIKISDVGKRDYLAGKRGFTNDLASFNQWITGNATWDDLQAYYNGTYKPDPQSIKNVANKGTTFNQNVSIQNTYNVNSTDIAQTASNAEKKASEFAWGNYVRFAN